MKKSDLPAGTVTLFTIHEKFTWRKSSGKMISSMKHFESPPTCDFDQPYAFDGRLIHVGRACFSIVSSPWFTNFHALAIPRRHVEHRFELTEEEEYEYQTEINRLAKLAASLTSGYEIIQKHQPDQVENGVKMNHLHTHVFPRTPDDPLIAGPQDFSNMRTPSPHQLEEARKFYRTAL